ncbi:ABC transporter ATP-binding protein [Nocardioides sp. InS609-2]|uniref:ABC transporter ATP-binding protein n=1 Tax=Nocardioides sp. InS609-2 TaxID=2760705 RepID=UPI0020BE4392|nr:ABC transporter ATP-binding protein [Nocardioides sp. InS609-2]
MVLSSAQDSMPVIETSGLTKDYGQVLALDSLDVVVGQGVTGLVGANGAGKSTLIKILLGLLDPTGGTARVLGHDIAAEGAAIRARVGYMPEHECLPPDVSASDFVVHMAQMSGLPHAAARERAADVLRHVGLAEERYRPMGGYSTGMKQRAKLAQALAHDPQLVLLDEPTNGLDPAARDDMLELVRRIGHDFGIAVLVTSHLLGELERVSEHVVVLDGGRLLRSSATSEFLDNTGTLLVEVLGGATERDRLGKALYDAGFACQPRGNVVAVDPPAADENRNVLDTIRDTAVDLGLGLVRIQPDHRRIEDIFREEVAGAVQPH